MADLYRQNVTTLAQALEQPETRVEATEALRGLIDVIILTPTDGELRIELKGNLAAMLSAGRNAKRPFRERALACRRTRSQRGRRSSLA